MVCGWGVFLGLFGLFCSGTALISGCLFDVSVGGEVDFGGFVMSSNSCLFRNFHWLLPVSLVDCCPTHIWSFVCFVW